MSTILLEIAIILALIAANGAFAMSEIAVLSARKARLQQRANDGQAGAKAALDLANSPNLFLSTAQVGITLVGILAGAYGGATLADQLTVYLDEVTGLGAHSHAVSLAVVVLGVTYLSLIFGELVPKRLALHNPERIAAAVAEPMRLLSVAASPVVRLLSASTDLALRVLRFRPGPDVPVTEEEIKVLLEQGTRAGMFEEAEQDMVERVFRLGDRRVNALMTPWTEIVWLDVDDAQEEIRDAITEAAYSRFPVAQESLDNVLGIVQVKELLAQSLAGRPIDLRSALRQPLFVPETMRALKLMELFKQSGTHFALVIDEYGGIQGLVTFNDVLEAIVGDIPTADEDSEPQIVQREDGSWLIDGLLSIDEMREVFDLGTLPGEERGDYQTLGGFALMHFGHIPSVSEHFHWGGLRFEVVDMDGNRIDKVLVTRDTPEPTALSS